MPLLWRDDVMFICSEQKSVAVAEMENICANCSACRLKSLNSGFYRCMRFDVAVELNETCETIDLLETRPIRHLAIKALGPQRV